MGFCEAGFLLAMGIKISEFGRVVPDPIKLEKPSPPPYTVDGHG